MNAVNKINLSIGVVLIIICIFMMIFYPFDWLQDFNSMSDREIFIVALTDSTLVVGIIMIISCLYFNKLRIKGEKE